MRALWLAAAACGCDGVLGLQPPVAADAGVSCPSGYQLAPTGTAYRLASVDAMTSGHFDMAESTCAADVTADTTGRTHVVVLSSEAERAYIAAMVAGMDAWVAMTDRYNQAGGTVKMLPYHWLTSEPAPVDSYWDDASQPANPASNGCVAMRFQTGRLVTDMCDPGNAHVVICECDRYPVVND